MTATTTTALLGDVVNATPSAARVLQKHGLDFCCGGRESLGDACRTNGVDVDVVLGELAALDVVPEPRWASMGPAELVDYIEATHHEYLHAELGLLDALLDKVVSVHGERHPELAELQVVYKELYADLDPHLAKEEQILFPMIRELTAADTAPSFHCGSLSNPISSMMADHDRAGDLLVRMRELTGDFTVPADACASYTNLYQRLSELETDTHMHVHKENNILFPAVVEMENRLAGA